MAWLLPDGHGGTFNPKMLSAKWWAEGKFSLRPEAIAEQEAAKAQALVPRRDPIAEYLALRASGQTVPASLYKALRRQRKKWEAAGKDTSMFPHGTPKARRIASSVATTSGGSDIGLPVTTADSPMEAPVSLQV